MDKFINNISEISAGNSVLFIGAGFNYGIKNLEGNAFPLGNDLKKKLELMIGIDKSEEDIETLANIILEEDDYDTKDLINMLENNFKIGKNDELSNHEEILSLPWKRIYTINYDNVVETISDKLGINRKSITLGHKVKDNIDKNLIIHLNGSINNLTLTTLQSEFKLSSTSYLQTDLINSDWYSVFKSDVDICKNIFFIGVSMNYDLDISRVIKNEDDYKEKIFFIDRYRTNDEMKLPEFKISSHKQTKFGSLHSIGIDKFSELIDKNLSKSKNTDEFSFNCLKELSASNRKIMDSPSIQLRELLVYGSIEEDFISTNTDNYLVHRDIEQTIYESISKKEFLIYLLIGQMANGKTSVISNLKYRLLHKGRVFVYDKYNSNLKDEIEQLKKISGLKYVFIENYYKYLKILNQFSLLIDFKQDNIIMVLTGRPFPNESVQHELPKRLGLNTDVFQVYSENLDKLTDTDVEKFDILLSNSNFLDDVRMNPNFNPVSYYRSKYKSQIYNILIDLVKNKIVRQELKENYSIIKSNKEFDGLVIASCICTVIGFKISLTNLLEILDIKKSSLAIKNNKELNLFLDFSNQNVQNKSSILANFVLAECNTPKQVLSILKKLIVNAHNSTDKAVTRNILHDVISSSNIYSLIYPLSKNSGKQRREDRKDVIEFYNDIKDLPDLKSNVFFWVQFSMACMDFKDYDRAFSNLEVAKKIVDQKKQDGKFIKDSIQVTTQKSRCSLEYAIHEKNIDNPYDLFISTNKELTTLIHDEEKTKHYLVYKIMNLYVDFYKTYKKSFETYQIRDIYKVIQLLSERIDSYISLNQFLGDKNKLMLNNVQSKFKQLEIEISKDLLF